MLTSSAKLGHMRCAGTNPTEVVKSAAPGTWLRRSRATSPRTRSPAAPSAITAPADPSDGDVARFVDRSFDDIRPGGRIGDREPAEHAVAFRSTFNDRLVCRCGVIALADHKRGAWVGPDDHVLSFDSGAGDLETDPPAFDLDDEEGEAPESTALRIAAAREEKDRRVMEAMTSTRTICGPSARRAFTSRPLVRHDEGSLDRPTSHGIGPDALDVGLLRLRAAVLDRAPHVRGSVAVPDVGVIEGQSVTQSATRLRTRSFILSTSWARIGVNSGSSSNLNDIISPLGNSTRTLPLQDVSANSPKKSMSMLLMSTLASWGGSYAEND
jgi:hypothetical protein